MSHAVAGAIDIGTLASSHSTNTIPRVTLFRDPAGNVWKPILAPVSSAEANQLRIQHERGDINLIEEPLPDEDFREAEMAFLQDHRDELARDHPGQWIAIDGPQLVASAADLPTLLQLVAEAGHPDPFITAIPAQPMTSLYA